MTNADISFVNGGGIRAPMASGEITFNDIFSVFPFNNQIVTAEISGQILLDFLEMAVMNYPEEDGSFPHMSGMVNNTCNAKYAFTQKCNARCSSVALYQIA